MMEDYDIRSQLNNFHTHGEVKSRPRQENYEC